MMEPAASPPDGRCHPGAASLETRATWQASKARFWPVQEMSFVYGVLSSEYRVLVPTYLR